MYTLIQNLEIQIGEIAKQLLDKKSGVLNVNVQTNLKEHSNAITTRSDQMSGNMEPKRIVVKSREIEMEKENEKDIEGQNISDEKGKELEEEVTKEAQIKG